MAMQQADDLKHVDFLLQCLIAGGDLFLVFRDRAYKRMKAR